MVFSPCRLDVDISLPSIPQLALAVLSERRVVLLPHRNWFVATQAVVCWPRDGATDPSRSRQGFVSVARGT